MRPPSMRQILSPLEISSPPAAAEALPDDNDESSREERNDEKETLDYISRQQREKDEG